MKHNLNIPRKNNKTVEFKHKTKLLLKYNLNMKQLRHKK